MKIKWKPTFTVLILGIAFGYGMTFLWDASAHPWLALIARIGLAFSVAFTLSAWAHQKRPQAAISGLLVSAIESVLWRGVYLWQSTSELPNTQPLTGSFFEMLVRLGMGFIAVVPILAIVCFAGAELGKLIRERFLPHN